MRELSNLRGSRRPTCMKECANVARETVRQAAAFMGLTQGVEIVDCSNARSRAFPCCDCGANHALQSRCVPCRINRHDVLDTRKPCGPNGLVKDIHSRNWRECDNNVSARTLHDVGHLFGFKERIDRIGLPGHLGAPKGEMRFWKVRQNNRYDGVRLLRQTHESTRRIFHTGYERRVGKSENAPQILRIGQEDQGIASLAVLRPLPKRFQYILWQAARCQRHLLETINIGF